MLLLINLAFHLSFWRTTDHDNLLACELGLLKTLSKNGTVPCPLILYLAFFNTFEKCTNRHEQKMLPALLHAVDRVSQKRNINILIIYLIYIQGGKELMSVPFPGQQTDN